MVTKETAAWFEMAVVFKHQQLSYITVLQGDAGLNCGQSVILIHNFACILT